MKLLKLGLVAVILLTGILAFNACQDIKSPIEDYLWILSYRSQYGNNISPLQGGAIEVYFDSKTMHYSGSDGCNQYSGTFQVEGLTLTINDDMVLTTNVCSEELMQQEKDYLAAFKAAGSFKMDHGNLYIYCGKDTLYFLRANSTQKPITQWGQ